LSGTVKSAPVEGEDAIFHVDVEIWLFTELVEARHSQARVPLLAVDVDLLLS